MSLNDETNRILDKIRKLLARADADRNDNEHEREIAMRQAQALLTKHGLDMAEVGETDPSVYEGALGKIEVEVQVAYWVSSVYHVIAELNGCTTIKQCWRGRGSSRITIFGRATRVTTARAMGDYVVASVKREMNAKHAEMPWMNKNKFSNDYGVGAAHGVNLQVKRILAEMKKGVVGEEQLSDSRALVVVDQHALATQGAFALRDETFPKLRKGGSMRAEGNAAYKAGRDFGSNIGLNKQVGGTARKQLGK